jgi:uncharacterized protein DUF4331
MPKLRLERVMLGLAAALSMSLAAPAIAADHRDAPTIDDYSAIDINDVYMFRDPSGCTPGQPDCNLVVALSTQAVADPLFGSSYHFQENALYRLNFTTRADAHPTATIDFVFGPFGNGPDCPATGPNAQPACQTFRAVFPSGLVVTGKATQGTSGPKPNSPNIVTLGDVNVFAGPRQDPFFFDLIGFNRSIASGTNQFTGVDAFTGKNINAIVVEFPASMVFPANSCVSQDGSLPLTACGVWAVTYLGNFNYDDPEKFEKRPEGLKQVDRMGNPAVNTALIPAPFKDAFNFGEPKDDPKDFTETILAQILNLDAKFKTCQNGNTSGAVAACNNRKTLPACLAAAEACNPNVQLLASVAVPDVLRFASNVPDGYPNGRRPQDPTTDLLIKLILNFGSFTDGTQPKQSCPAFPFLAPPLQLTDATLPPVQPTPLPCP